MPIHEDATLDHHDQIQDTPTLGDHATSIMEPAQPNTQELSTRPQRERHPPKHLQDYVCTLPIVTSLKSNFVSSSTTHPLSCYLSYSRFVPSHQIFSSQNERKSYTQAIKDPKWREAMEKEIVALEDNQTWSLQTLPPGKKPIGSKWVFKIKYKANGEIERYKARLVAKGYTQIEGLDYNETFAPVVKLTTVRCLLAVAAAKHWDLHQLDVTNAFLHGDLHEEVYMSPPPGLLKPEDTRVCRLRKSLYGLKQASRQWFEKFSTALVQFGFVQSKADHSLFTLRDGMTFTVVLVYVDDLIIAGNSPSKCQVLKTYLNDRFHIKDLGSLKYFLGLDVTRSPDGIMLCQRKYALDILEETGMLGSRPAHFPMEQQHHLSSEEGSLLPEPGQYRRLVGRLIYLTITRPEITYAVHILSQLLQKPRQPHLDAVTKVLRYLKNAPGQGLFFPTKNDFQLRGYCDSDWASCPTTRCSTSGYFTQLGQAPISWKTKKQVTVSRSSAEAEYRSMAFTTCELLWLRSLLQHLTVSHPQPVFLHCDNQAALYISANSIFHERKNTAR